MRLVYVCYYVFSGLTIIIYNIYGLRVYALALRVHYA